MLLEVFNDMVPGIGVECVCLSGAMLAKAGTDLDRFIGLACRANKQSAYEYCSRELLVQVHAAMMWLFADIG